MSDNNTDPREIEEQTKLLDDAESLLNSNPPDADSALGLISQVTASELQSRADALRAQAESRRFN